MDVSTVLDLNQYATTKAIVVRPSTPLFGEFSLFERLRGADGGHATFLYDVPVIGNSPLSTLCQYGLPGRRDTAPN